LEIAADLAGHFHAELYLVNAIPMFPTTTLPDLIPEAEFIRETRADVKSASGRWW
jgi:nucleotide-binding universal stress UspA family protein